MELSVIIPTFKERENIRPLYEKLSAALLGLEWEAVYVDDNSPDGTAAEVLALAREESRVRLIRRVGRKGLSSACVEGMLSSSAAVFAVIDADMQHDERILPQMLDKIRGGCDIVVGTRYAEGGSTGEWGKGRVGMSRLATRMAGVLLKSNNTSDPMSGFFMLKRELLDEVVGSLSEEGFKILLDILATAKRTLNIGEVSYTFRTRQFGESKLDIGVLWDFALLLADKIFGRFIPARFLMFVGVGLVGVLVHLCVLGLLSQKIGVAFWESQLTATFVAMCCNFFINNMFTYSDRRLKGKRQWWGLAKFMLGCGVGAAPNVFAADYLYDSLGAYWLLSGFMGMLISSVWNFSVSSHFIWRNRS